MPWWSDRRRAQVRDLLLANLVFVGTFVVWIVSGGFFGLVTDNLLAQNVIPLMVASLGSTLLVIRYTTAATWASIGLARARSLGLATGTVSGSLCCGLLVLAMVVTDLASWVPIDPDALRLDWRDWWLPGLGLLLIGSVAEEIFLRGVVLQLVCRAVGPLPAVLATSVAFALLHSANADVTVLAQVNTAIFGAVFGLAVIRHGSLWLAMGLHFGWNVTQVALGSNVSGIAMRLTDLSLELGGPVWLTGGSYGLEGGLLGTVAGMLLVGWIASRPVSTQSGRTLWEIPAGATETGTAGGLLGDGADPTTAGRAQGRTERGKSHWRQLLP